MKVEIDYSNLTPIQKHNKAIEDTKSYLGAETFDKLIVEIRKADGITLRDLEIQLGMFAGIEGYPVKAIWNYAFPECGGGDIELT